MNAFPIIVTHTIHEVSETTETANRATRGMLRARAVELAVMNGRPPYEVLKSDWESAKRELSATR